MGPGEPGTFTGTVGGITKAMVGLGSVDNTADASKPVSTAQAAADTAVASAAAADATSKAAAAQAAAVQRANHTGTQPASTITGLAAVATSNAYADLSGKPALGTAASAASSDFAAATHTHPLSALTQSSAATGQVVTWNGSAWAPATAAVSSPSLSVHSSSADFPATGSASALYLAEDTSRLYQWESAIYVEVGVSGGGVALSDGSVTTAKIADAAVTDAKIASVAATKLTGTLADARLSSSVTVNSNLRWAMQASGNAIDWLPRGHGVIGNAGAFSGSLNLAFFTAPTNSTVTTITFVSGGTATASLTLCKFALFTVSETITDGTTLTSPTITMVAQTASDTTIGNVSNTIYSRVFSTAGGYPSSYSLIAGTRYAVGFLLVGTTAGTWQAGTLSTGAFMRLPPMAAGNVTSLSDMPTSATTVSLGSYMLYGRIS